MKRPLTPLSSDAIAARRPLPVVELFDTRHEAVHSELRCVRPAMTVRVRSGAKSTEVKA